MADPTPRWCYRVDNYRRAFILLLRVPRTELHGLGSCVLTKD